MKEILSNRINNLAVSQTLAMAAKARELKSQGKDVIGLSLGEPDFNTPDFIKEAAIKAIQDNYNSYTPVDGYVELKKAIINKFERDNKLNYNLSQIVVSTGAKQSLSNIAASLINPGDEVILPCPYWVSYRDIIKLNGGIPIEVKTSISSDFKISGEDLEKSITSKTKMLWFSSPCNPSGSVYSESELREISDILLKYPEIYVVSDEIYEHINFSGGHSSIAAFDDMYDRTITVNGVSKAFAMTGWRIGYAAGPAKVIGAMKKIQSQSTSNPCSVSQAAATEALSGPQECVGKMVVEFKKRHNYLVDALNQLPGVNCIPGDGTFYAFPDFQKVIDARDDIADDIALAEYFLSEAGVALVPGSAFGSPGCMRLSFATSMDTLQDAIARLKKVML